MGMIARIRALGSQINYRHPLTIAIASSATVGFVLVGSWAAVTCPQNPYR